MCHLFLQVAKLYIQAKRNDARGQLQSMVQPAPNNVYTTTDGTQIDLNYMTQFDPYLSALGLVPNSAWPMAGYNDTSTISTAMERIVPVISVWSRLSVDVMTLTRQRLPSGSPRQT